MNALEHLEVLKDKFESLYLGRVEDVVDVDNLNRVKIRVFGIYDEPVELEHIPFAESASSKAVTPNLGDIVTVFFVDGDFMLPIFVV